MEVVAKFFANPDNLILFVVPLVVMIVATLALTFVFPSEDTSHKSGRLEGYSDLHREAYVGALIAAAVTVIIFVMRGGPEPFVLVWKPLLSTVMMLPFGYALALAIGGMAGMTRSKA